MALTGTLGLEPGRSQDLAVSNLIRNRKLSRAIADSDWSEFWRMLEYKCRWAGGQAAGRGQVFPVQQGLRGLRCEPGGVDA